MNEKQAENKALTLAYRCVLKTGWTPAKLTAQCNITYNTLRRINQGRKGKANTDAYYLKVFVRLLKEAFDDDLIKNGGGKSQWFHKVFRNILFAQNDLDDCNNRGTSLQ